MSKKTRLQMQKRRHETMQHGRSPMTWGEGHRGNTPLPDIEPVPPTHKLRVMMAHGLIQPGTTLHTMGDCLIQLSPPMDAAYGWHLSISHPKRYPTWDEIAKARYALMPDDVTAIMVLPPSGDYVNIHPYCFQLHEEGKQRTRR